MYNEFERHLLDLIDHVMLAYIVVWAVYLLKFRRIDSYSVTITIFVLFSSLMTVVTPYLYSFAKSGDIIAYKAAWHLFYSMVFVLEIKSLSLMHKSFNLKVSRVTSVFVVGLSVQAFLHLIRLLEKATLETSYTAFLYTEGIKFVNLMFVFLSVLCIILAGSRKYQLDKKCI